VRPHRERFLVGRHERDRVETADGIHERRLETRQLDHREAIARFAIERPTRDRETVLAEIAGYVLVGVDPGEVDPRAVAGAAIGVGAVDVDTDLRKREYVMAAADVSADERETERSHRGDSEGLLRSGWEVDAQRSGIDAHFDLEIRG
jgi:hypothetical protein